MRLQKRKHRPAGSLLRRKCLCSRVGSDLCVVHRLQSVLLGLKPGTEVFGFSAYEFHSLLKKFLVMLDISSAGAFTLKAFRAGKANALVLAGVPLGQLLAAGEWKSRAVLKYVDEDVFDGAQLIAAELDNSDCE